MMNIDRPLDELVKEARQAKRQQLRQRRTKKPTPSAPQAAGVAAKENDADTSGNKDTSPRVRGGIRKKRRSRGAMKATGTAAEVEVKRKLSPKEKTKHVGRKTNKGAKVSVSNLDPGVTQTDIVELFETIGPLRSSRLIVLNDGRSSGCAEVLFENMGDALEAIKKYNEVPLDNRPLKITLSTESAPIRLPRGRRAGGGGGGGARKVLADPDGGANSGSDGRGRRSPRYDDNVEKDGDRFYDDRFNDADRFAEDRFADDRFADGGRGYSRRNGRRAGGGGGGRNGRSYDRRPSSPGDNRRYVD